MKAGGTAATGVSGGVRERAAHGDRASRRRSRVVVAGLCLSAALAVARGLFGAEPAAQVLAARAPAAPSATLPPSRPSTTTPPTTVADLVTGIRETARSLEPAAGMRSAYEPFLQRHGLVPADLPYADFVAVRLLFESTRDAGLWNLQWRITDREPRSDAIWTQWQAVAAPRQARPTATAECDELSALFAFLARSLGVRGVGLFWPYSNHTVAVWVVRPRARPPLRVVVPTTQIFLAESDLFDTDRFDPWRQREIHEYTRRDAAATLRMPPALVAFFLAQSRRYGGAGDLALQRLRYLREAVFQGRLSPAEAAVLARRAHVDGVTSGAAREDVSAFASFVKAMEAP
jgi:hypothetical protein